MNMDSFYNEFITTPDNSQVFCWVMPGVPVQKIIGKSALTPNEDNKA